MTANAKPTNTQRTADMNSNRPKFHEGNSHKPFWHLQSSNGGKRLFSTFKTDPPDLSIPYENRDFFLHPLGHGCSARNHLITLVLLAHTARPLTVVKSPRCTRNAVTRENSLPAISTRQYSQWQWQCDTKRGAQTSGYILDEFRDLLSLFTNSVLRLFDCTVYASNNPSDRSTFSVATRIELAKHQCWNFRRRGEPSNLSIFFINRSVSLLDCRNGTSRTVRSFVLIFQSFIAL